MNIRLCKMTNAAMHEFFQQFVYDPAAIADPVTENYIYDEQTVDAYYEKHQRQGKLHFAIMLGDTVIGDIYLKNIDPAEKSCTMGIHMVNDQYKGKGYGTQAEILLLMLAFNEVNMEVVNADTLIKNTRSRWVLEKAGFVEIYRDKDMCYFECRKSDWRSTFDPNASCNKDSIA